MTVYDVIDEEGQVLFSTLLESGAKAFADAGNKFAESLNAKRIAIEKPALPARIWKVIASEFVAAQ